MVPKLISPALRNTASLVHCMLAEWMQMPEDPRERSVGRNYGKFVCQAHPAQVASGDYSTWEAIDLDHFFARIMTPQFTIALCEDSGHRGPAHPQPGDAGATLCPGRGR